MRTSAELVSIQALSPALCAALAAASTAASLACGSGVPWATSAGAIRNNTAQRDLSRRIVFGIGLQLGSEAIVQRESQRSNMEVLMGTIGIIYRYLSASGVELHFGTKKSDAWI